MENLSARELRIGNIIIKNGKVHYTNHLTIRDIYGLSIDDTDTFEPIPLTEEWLLKFGFIKSKLEGYDVHFKYSHHLLHSSITALYNAEFSLSLDNVARGIKYVHQLQNLYFALTGEELTFKEQNYENSNYINHCRRTR